MTGRNLTVEVAEFLASREGATTAEVAAGVRGRYADVRQVLHDGPFVPSPTPVNGSPRATHWANARTPSHAFPATDTDYLAAILADGEWHRLDRIIDRSQRERGHGFTVHSRAADLRKRGLTVEQRSERTGRRVRSFYRLVSLDTPSVIPHEDDARSMRGVEGVSSETGQAAATSSPHPDPPLETPVSLTLFTDVAA